MGGDWTSRRPSPIFSVEERARLSKLPISPLEGEMSGRTEGGINTPAVRLFAELHSDDRRAAHPPCFVLVPKSTFGTCILSSSTVKLAKG
ncbi:hypothetical protein FJW06_20300 [Mesorhizobium sp. B4-1-3]|nr:hypothetical protein FJW06_20300 [Mesorhizobium sp. B4-1-3]